MSPALEILSPLRSTIVSMTAITSKLGTYNGSPSVHTRRPVPEDAGYPMIVIGPIAARGDEDGVNDSRPVVVVDLNTYGEQTEQYREVEEVADLLYQLLHRQRAAITVDNFSVIDLRCSGPVPAPVDDVSRVGRRVTLTARLFAT